MLTLEKFEEASEKVKEVVLPTNLIYSEYFSEQTGNKVYFKPENMQYTGAYKVRGAYYKISTLSEEEREKGLVTASAGNHAQGVAYAAKLYGVPATVVMPTTTPLIKVNRTKGYGAKVVLHGSVYDEACQYALELAKKEGATFVHPFNDEVVATGQGTIAMEIFKELPTVDIILVPIGGGGLAAGQGGGAQRGAAGGVRGDALRAGGAAHPRPDGSGVCQAGQARDGAHMAAKGAFGRRAGWPCDAVRGKLQPPEALAGTGNAICFCRKDHRTRRAAQARGAERLRPGGLPRTDGAGI